MISTGSRAALALTLAVLITGCDQGIDDGSELGDGPSTIGDVGDDTTDTGETGSDDATSSSDSGSSDTTDSSSSDTSTDTTDGTTGDPLPCEGMVVSIEADFYNSDGVHLAPAVFDECMSIVVGGGTSLDMFVDLGGTTLSLQIPSIAIGETPIDFQTEGFGAYFVVDAMIPTGWQGAYSEFDGTITVDQLGFGLGDQVTMHIDGSVTGPDLMYFADVAVDISVRVQVL